MATVLRRRLLVNPAKKKKRKNRARRKMTAKQIRIFGTPAQKAALKRKRKTKAHRSNPKKKAYRPKTRPRTAPRRKRRARKNVSEIITASLAGLANPGRRRRKSKKQKKGKRVMAKARRNRKNAARRPSHAKKQYRRRKHNRMNPTSRRRRHHVTRHRRNPGSMSGITNVLIDAGWAAGGAIGSRALTQLVLQSNNSGIMGYGANLVSGFLLSWGVKSIMKNSRAAADVVMGTLIGVILRALQDFTPLGQAAQLSGLGDFLATQFFTPRALVDPRSGQMVLPAGVGTPAPAANTGARNAGVGAFYSRRMYGR